MVAERTGFSVSCAALSRIHAEMYLNMLFVSLFVTHWRAETVGRKFFSQLHDTPLIVDLGAI